MKVAVFDTYVTKKDGTIMHFDIVVPQEVKDTNQVHAFGKAYLTAKGQAEQSLSSKECTFCHIGQASDKMVADINLQGFSIIEMEGCNN
jgi:Domain of unknown function (DUF2024)